MRPGLLCPGKGRRFLLAHERPPHFNEAGAVMPRKRPYAIAGSEAGRSTSMRPGLLCPGKAGREGGDMKGVTAFNEAGAVMPRKSTDFERMKARDMGLQ